MSLKEKAIQSIALALSVAVMGSVAEAANMQVVSVAAVNQVTITKEAENTKGITAGVVLSLNELEEQAFESANQVSVAQMRKVTVTAAQDALNTVEEAIAAVPELTEEQRMWKNRLMADIDDKMNVRAQADGESEIVGRFRKGDVAEIIEVGTEWTHIQSGNVNGYIKNEYCKFGLEALEYAKATVDTTAVITGNGIRVRTEASSEAEVVTVVSEGTVLVVNTQAEVPEGWLAVKYAGKTRFISAEYAKVELAVTNAITIAEEQEEERRRKEEEEKKKAAQVTEVKKVQKAAVSASTDEVTLLAALIQCEAGGESYEGQVAVGAVVMNRVRSGNYPSTVHDVIYQKGQFTPVGSGKLAARIAAGPKDSCIRAAQEALNGVDNTGGATRFKQSRTGHAGLVIGNHVFY